MAAGSRGKQPIRVIVVGGYEVVRSGLRTMLGQEPDIHVVGGASSAGEALRLIKELEPQVAVVDYGLSRVSGVELCEVIAERHPEVRVVMVSSQLQDAVIHGALSAGARAFVSKDVDGPALKQIIRRVACGETILDPKVVARVIDWATARPFRPSAQVLSTQETKVMRLVAQGRSNQEIAEEMGLALNTVKNYLSRALSKLDCRSRVEGAVKASRQGLL